MLPEDLRRTCSVRLLDEMYRRSFLEMLDFDGDLASGGDEDQRCVLDRFTQNLLSIRARHATVVRKYMYREGELM